MSKDVLNLPKGPMVTQMFVFGMQVCVPEDWTDEQIIAFSEEENPAGTSNGWHVQKEVEGNPDYIAKGPCEQREGYVHVVLTV